MTQILFRSSTPTETASAHNHYPQRPSRHYTAPASASASASHTNWPLTNDPPPNFSYKKAVLLPITSPPTARFAKYGLGKGSKTATKASTSTTSSRPGQTQRVTVLNATPALEPGFFDSDRSDREPVLLRPLTPLSFGRPGFPRAASSPAAMGVPHRRNEVTPRGEKPAPHDLSSFTALPVNLSRAAAKRLGVLVDPGREMARSRSRQYSVSTSSDNHSLSEGAPSISDMSDSSVNYLGSQPRECPAPSSRSNQDSWPLSSRHPPLSGMMENSIYSSSSMDENTNVPAAASSIPSVLRSSLRHDGDRGEKASRNTSQSRPPMQSRHVSWSDSQSSQSPRLQHPSVSRTHRTKELVDTGSERNGNNPVTYRNPALRSDVLERHYNQYLQQSPPLGADEAHDLQLEPTHSIPTTHDFAAFIEEAITPKSAEQVILNIFQHADSFADLFATARLNRGFYSVFKRHELALMKGTLYNFSPAAWEYRESSSTQIIAGTRDSFSDYTPTTYVQFHRRDQYIINDIRTQIARHCQRILRQDTINAVHNAGSAGGGRFDDAIWRIWTFCDLFAVNRRTENDFAGQMAWLNGTRAPQTTTSQTKTLSSGRSSTSTNTSTKSRRSFARGNPEGLATDQIEDILEIWGCLGLLLQGIKGPGRVAQARRYGVFDGMEIDFSNPRAEEAMLEEWVWYLLTLGPSVVVDLAAPARSQTVDVFRIARDMGWTSWRPCSKDCCRAGFLRNVAGKVYEQRLRSSRPNMLPRASSARSQSHQDENNISRDQVRDQSTTNLANSVGLWARWADQQGTSQDSAEVSTKSKDVGKVGQVQSRYPQQRYSPGISISLFPPQYTRPLTPTPSMDY